ncbi:putative monooxygenase p33MONOX [Galemys pyrenaicus]|uniref:Putative monooxygenase p33MONOX n=1 Tax=Galemys pyrenaicus TaxID=202257 RepID=A0A8J6DDL1_GALPY|nr:putative monooxygenase p33MONOX [Galemys pyrenaicus]
MSLPIGMHRRAFSYDDALEDPTPMTPPPSDMGSIPWKPVIPERKYQDLAKVEEGEASVSSPAMTLSSAVGSVDKAYKGAQKPSPMELMRVQATRMAEDPVAFKPPKMDIPVTEGKKQLPRTHNLKPRDLNVLTPTGF